MHAYYVDFKILENVFLLTLFNRRIRLIIIFSGLGFYFYRFIDFIDKAHKRCLACGISLVDACILQNSGEHGAHFLAQDLSGVFGQLQDSGLPVEISEENMTMTYKVTMNIKR